MSKAIQININTYYLEATGDIISIVMDTNLTQFIIEFLVKGSKINTEYFQNEKDARSWIEDRFDVI